MAKTNYGKMYKAEEEVTEVPVEPAKGSIAEEIKKEEIKKEEIKKSNTKKEKKNVIPESGKVIGNASLNVRQKPTMESGVITTITPGTEISIIDQSDEWYKISIPVSGFVMKKFVEV